MTVIETCLVTIAMASAVVGVTAVLLAVRLGSVMQRAEIVLDSTRQVLVRLESSTTEIESILKDARRVESRIARSADRILDEVEIPLRIVPALMSGVRAGIASMFRNPNAASHSGSRETLHSNQGD